MFDFNYSMFSYFVNIVSDFYHISDTFSSILIYFEALLQSEGLLSSIQFGFTALLTLLIPLIVVLFEKKKNPEYELDKKIINRLVPFKNLIISTIFATLLILLFNNDKESSSVIFNFTILALLIIPWGYLIYTIWQVIKALEDLQPFRDYYVRKYKTGDVADFWEEYFYKLGESKKEDTDNNSKKYFGGRQKYKFVNEERGWIKLFFETLKNLNLTKESDIKFANQILESLKDNLKNLNLYNIFYLDLSVDGQNKTTPLKLLLKLHFEVWRIDKQKLTNTVNKPDLENDWINYSILSGTISQIIEEIEKMALDTNFNWYIFVQELKKHLDLYKDEKLPKSDIANDKEPHFYLDSLDIYETFFENIAASPNKHNIQESKDYFPYEWRTSLQIDTKKKLWKNWHEGKKNMTQVWWNKIYLFLFEEIFKDSYTDKSYNEKINSILRIFFPNVSQIYLSWFLTYVVKFSNNKTDRIKSLIANHPSFGYYDISGSTEYYENEEEQKLKIQSGFEQQHVYACKIAYSLFKNIFDENLKNDLAEIKKLKEETNLSENEQRNLKLVEEIWSNLEKQT